MCWAEVPISMLYSSMNQWLPFTKSNSPTSIWLNSCPFRFDWPPIPTCIYFSIFPLSVRAYYFNDSCLFCLHRRTLQSWMGWGQYCNLGGRWLVNLLLIVISRWWLRCSCEESSSELQWMSNRMADEVEVQIFNVSNWNASGVVALVGGWMAVQMVTQMRAPSWPQ